MKFIFLLIFLTMCVKLSNSEKVICDSSKEITVDENEIIFFESQNYPNEMFFDAKKDCKLRIIGNSTKENMIIIFVMTKGGIQRGEFIDGNEYSSNFTYNQISSLYHFTHKNSLTFFFGDPKLNVYDVFQGFITFEELKDDGCLLSSKPETFKFKDETQMLYLRSSYFTGLQYFIRSKSQECFWTFSAPEGFMFKLSEIKMIKDSTIVVHSNQTREIIKSDSPHYFDVQKISISYTNSEAPQKNGNEAFYAYLSIVSKVRATSNSSCSFTDSTKFSEWEKKYESNNFEKVFCSISTPIKPSHQLIINITKFTTVSNSDVLGYYMDSEGLQFHALNKAESFMLEPNEDGSVRNVKWEYYSDEGFNGLSFRIEFQEVECKCSTLPFIVPCSGEASYSLMENNENYFYCANTVCNYTIKPNENCSNAFISVNIFMKFANFYDNYNININEKIVKTTSDISMELWATPIHNILIQQNTSAIFHFLPVSNGRFSSNVGYLKITLSPFYKPVLIDELILSNQNPMTILELDKIKGNAAMNIKLSNDLEDDEMELSYGGSKIQSLLQCITIFSDNNFTEVFKLDVNNFTVILPSSVTLYKYLHCDKEISKLTFRAQNSQSIGCFFHNTVFQLSKLNRRYLSMISDPTGLCEIMLINLPGQYGIKTVWTNSKKENIVLKNALDNSTLISFK